MCAHVRVCECAYVSAWYAEVRAQPAGTGS